MSLQWVVVGKWSFTLFGDFRAVSPDGLVVAFHNRKLEALVGLLVVHGEHGIERRMAGEILWPDAEEARGAANLRVLLFHLRRILGEDAIVANRHSIRLSMAFEYETDWAGGERSGVFLPGHEGAWFDMIRSDATYAEETPEGRGTVVEAWLQVLEWQSKHDPVGFGRTLRSEPATTEGIPFASLQRLLRRVSNATDDPWIEYWWGTAEDDLRDCVVHLKKALRIALASGETLLASRVCLELGKALARIGVLDEALKIGSLAEDIAKRSSVPEATVNWYRLKATTNLQWGRVEKGMIWMDKAIQRSRSPIEQAQSAASLALFQSGLGLCERAESNLKAIEPFGSTFGHQKIQKAAALARAILLVQTGADQSAADQLRTVAINARADGHSQFVNYAEELLGTVCSRQKEPGLAQQHRLNASDARQKTGDALTPWMQGLRRPGSAFSGQAFTM